MGENLKAKMHEADWFEAYKNLADQGLSADEIAKRFGHSVATVRKLLKLGGVAPAILEAFRSKALTKDAVMAYTVTDDQERQLAVFEEMEKWPFHSAFDVRQRLLPSTLRSDAALVRFVTLEAYERAGGTTSTDLFADVVYLDDPELVQKLAGDRVRALADDLKADGWKWVESALDGVHSHPLTHAPRLKAECLEVPESLTARLDTIDKELNKLNEKAPEDWTEEDQEREDQLQEEEHELQEEKENAREFTDEQKGRAGVLIALDYRNGETIYLKGIVKPEDAPTNEAGDVESTEQVQPDESAALRRDLEAYHLQALQADLMKSPALCFDLSTFNLAVGQLKDFYMGKPLDGGLSPICYDTKDIDETLAAQAMLEARSALNLSWLTETGSRAQFEAFQALEDAEKAAIHAYCVARSLRSASGEIGGCLSEQQGFDLSAYWKPTKDNYFKRVKREKLLAILEELKGSDVSSGMANAKKRDLAEVLDGLDEAKGWLPEMVRPKAVTQED